MNKKVSRFVIAGILCCTLIGSTTYAADTQLTMPDGSSTQGAPGNGTNGSQTSFTHGSDTVVSEDDLKTEIPSGYDVNSETQGKAKNGDYKKLFDSDSLQEVNITIDENNWNYLLQNANDEPTVMADSVGIGDTSVGYVGIKTKGNITLSNTWQSDSDRFSFTVNVGKYIKKSNGYSASQNYYGLSKFCLNSVYGDATYMKEYLSYKLMESMGVPTPYCCLVKLSVNGQFIGVYCMVESIDSALSARTLGDSNADLYKCESPGGDLIYSDTLDSYLDGTSEFDLSTYSQSSNPLSQYTGIWDRKESGTMIDDYLEEISSASTEEEIASANETGEEVKSDMKEVLTWMKQLNALSNAEDPNTDTYKTELESILNVDEVLRYFAANTFLVSLDSYQSEKEQNYCLTFSNGKVTIIPWDYNYSYGAYGVSTASDMINFSIDNPVWNTTLLERPLLNVLLQNDDYFALYKSYLEDCCKIVSTGGTVTGTNCQGTAFTTDYESNYFNGIIDNFLNGILGTALQETSVEAPFYTYEQYVSASSALEVLNTQRALAVSQQVEGNTETVSDEGISLSTLGANLGGAGGGGNMPSGSPGTFPSDMPSGFPGTAPSGMPGSFPPGATPSSMPSETSSVEPTASASPSTKSVVSNSDSTDTSVSTSSTSISPSASTEPAAEQDSTLYAPEGITYQNVKDTSLVVAWTDVKEADGYYIYKYNATKKEYVLYKTTTSNTCKISGLEAGSTYKFKVCAFQKTDDGIETGTYTVILKAGTKLPQSSLSVSSNKGTSVKLSFSKVTNSDGYEIYSSTSKNGTYKKVAAITNTTYTNKNLLKNQTYYYKIRSFRTVGGVKVYSSFSNIVVKE